MEWNVAILQWEKDSLAEKIINYKIPDGLLFLACNICLEIQCHQLSKKQETPSGICTFLGEDAWILQLSLFIHIE